MAPTQAREPICQGRRETSLQRATLLLIDRLIVVESPSHLYAAVLLQIIKYVAEAVSVKFVFVCHSLVSSLLTHLVFRESSSIDRESAHAFAKRSMPVLSALFCKRCPAEVQVAFKSVRLIYN